MMQSIRNTLTKQDFYLAHFELQGLDTEKFDFEKGTNMKIQKLMGIVTLGTVTLGIAASGCSAKFNSTPKGWFDGKPNSPQQIPGPTDASVNLLANESDEQLCQGAPLSANLTLTSAFCFEGYTQKISALVKSKELNSLVLTTGDYGSHFELSKTDPKKVSRVDAVANTSPNAASGRFESISQLLRMSTGVNQPQSFSNFPGYAPSEPCDSNLWLVKTAPGELAAAKAKSYMALPNYPIESGTLFAVTTQLISGKNRKTVLVPMEKVGGSANSVGNGAVFVKPKNTSKTPLWSGTPVMGRSTIAENGIHKYVLAGILMGKPEMGPDGESDTMIMAETYQCTNQIRDLIKAHGAGE